MAGDESNRQAAESAKFFFCFFVYTASPQAVTAGSVQCATQSGVRAGAAWSEAAQNTKQNPKKLGVLGVLAGGIPTNRTPASVVASQTIPLFPDAALATWSFALVCALALDSACNIKNCEQGASCHEDGDNAGNEPASNECLDFCARLSFCDHGLPNGFDACLSTCKQRFETDAQSAAKLCVCAEWSECEDLMAGKCSAHDPSGSGGTSASVPQVSTA